jgi:hypothetical protein
MHALLSQFNHSSWLKSYGQYSMILALAHQNKYVLSKVQPRSQPSLSYVCCSRSRGRLTIAFHKSRKHNCPLCEDSDISSKQKHKHNYKMSKNLVREVSIGSIQTSLLNYLFNLQDQNCPSSIRRRNTDILQWYSSHPGFALVKTFRRQASAN